LKIHPDLSPEQTAHADLAGFIHRFNNGAIVCTFIGVDQNSFLRIIPQGSTQSRAETFKETCSLIDINFTAALYAQDGFLVERSAELAVFGKATFRLLTLVIASDDTMKNTSRKKITSIIGMISIRAFFTLRLRSLILLTGVLFCVLQFRLDELFSISEIMFSRLH